MIPFTKAHACGNDFLVVEEEAAAGREAELARQLCARTTGVGADGIEFLRRGGAGGSMFLRLFNADGSEAELSGNGTRCVAAVLAHTEGRREVVFGTHGGDRRCRVISEDRGVYWIESGMGVPRVMPRSLQMSSLRDGAETLQGAIVNVGNPHYVVFSESEDFAVHGMAWQELGALLSKDPRFPRGTNVEFVRVLARDRIAFRIFERGCGPTTSSGTGTCASAAAAMTLRGAGPSLTAVAEGGAQEVVWAAREKEMLLTGPAQLICSGEVLLTEGTRDHPTGEELILGDL